MSVRGLLGHIEMGVLLVLFRGGATTMAIKKLVRFAAALSERLPPTFANVERRGAVERAKRAARRVSRFVPGATCLHRALASRVWLARRGIPTDLVVGFRRDGELEGHAWLEIGAVDGSETLFVEEGYREAFREAELLEGEVDGAGSWPREESREEISREDRT